MLFVAYPQYAEVAFRAFLFSIYLNLVLLLLGIAGAGALASMMGPERWGTLLNYPGSLSRVGVLGVCFSAYMVLANDKALQWVSLLIASLLLVYFDGSRTSLLVLVGVALPFLLAVRLAERRGSRFTSMRLGFALVITIFLGIAVWRFVPVAPVGSDTGPEPIRRVVQFASSLKLQGSAGLALADPVRARMLSTGLEALQNAGLLGTGIGSTRADTDVGVMVVHMTYLQILGDLGVLGLLAYVSLILGWLPKTRRAFRNIRSLQTPQERAIYYNAIFLLVAFALQGVFHPLSTEWSEWIAFIVPYALFWQAVRGPSTESPRQQLPRLSRSTV
jgi:hypothetical protein